MKFTARLIIIVVVLSIRNSCKNKTVSSPAMAATNKKATDWEIEDGKELVERKVCMKLESEARAFLTNNMLYQYGNRYENNVLFKSDCSMSINYFLATSHVV